MQISPDVRRNQILQMLVDSGSVKNSELIKIFDVTAETIRKDLLSLESMGVVEKEHGGAKISPSYLEAPINLRSQLRREQKNAIAQQAIDLLPNGVVIFIDSGSTALCFAEKLVQKENITVITNSLAVANTIAGINNSNEVYIACGFVKKNAFTLNGPYTIDSINHFKPAFAFMATNGIQYHDGPTCKDYRDIEIKKAIINNCEKTVLLCDSNKFHQGAVLQYAQWDDVDYFITDSNSSKNDLNRIGKDTKIIIAPCENKTSSEEKITL
jgi:DeoR family fructose operon transcriptional repressor